MNTNILKRFALTCLSMCLGISVMQAQNNEDTFWLGADISGVTELEGHGQKFYTVDGQERDLYDLMKDYGINGVRLRVWVDPTDGYCAPVDVLEMGKRAKAAGLPVMVDFHYSDWWADPGKQNMPKRWEGKNLDELRGLVYEHTASTLQMLRNAGVDVPWVQVGNETPNGMMWPVARSENMANYAALSNAGYDAVKAIYPEATVITHLDNGWDRDLYDWFFDAFEENGGKWDMIGMSLYPYWSMQDGRVKSEEETLEKCIDNVNHLWGKYGKPLMITEIGVEAMNPESGKAFIAKSLDQFRNNTNGHCKGVWYWAPEADGVLDGYKLGAFQNRRPTVIMEAFREAAKR